MAETVEVDAPVEEEIPEAVREEIEKVVRDTKKGFDLKERLKGRGLRKATLNLYLDEDKGPELGWAYDGMDQFRNKTGRRIRDGVVGELDALEQERADTVEQFNAQHSAWAALEDATATEPVLDLKDISKKIADLEKKRDKLIEELTTTGITVKMRAVPPVIQKDTRRRAKQTLGINSKTVPDDMIDKFVLCQTAHLMTVLIQSVTDNQTGEVNVGLNYDDAIALMDYLPVGQYQRLNGAMDFLQFTDAISRDIEGQEDFS